MRVIRGRSGGSWPTVGVTIISLLGFGECASCEYSVVTPWYERHDPWTEPQVASSHLFAPSYKLILIIVYFDP